MLWKVAVLLSVVIQMWRHDHNIQVGLVCVQWQKQQLTRAPNEPEGFVTHLQWRNTRLYSAALLWHVRTLLAVTTSGIWTKNYVIQYFNFHFRLNFLPVEIFRTFKLALVFVYGVVYPFMSMYIHVYLYIFFSEPAYMITIILSSCMALRQTSRTDEVCKQKCF